MNIVAVKFEEAAYYEVKPGDPVKYRNTLYGKALFFNRDKKHVKFTSEYSEPAYLNYDQIERVTVFPINKKRMLILAGIGSILIIGVPFIFAVLNLAPWKIEINLKKAGPKEKPIIVRPFLGSREMGTLVKFISSDLDTTYYPDLKARKQAKKAGT